MKTIIEFDDLAETQDYEINGLPDFYIDYAKALLRQAGISCNSNDINKIETLLKSPMVPENDAVNDILVELSRLKMQGSKNHFEYL